MSEFLDFLWFEFADIQIQVLKNPENEQLRHELKNVHDAIVKLETQEIENES